ncbi:MAG: permease [Bacteroidetes bacterium]|nr:MAG: permease [Bacteroidota bacterium]
MFVWLEHISQWLVYDLLGLQADSHLGAAMSFFFYDTVKIFILLMLISWVMGAVNSYLPVERLRAFLNRHQLYGLEYLMASIFGALTPFCSCSSVPLFIGFVKGGIPLGVTFSFLITSPLVNEVALAMFLGMFGVKVTLIYAVSGILVGTISGRLLSLLRLEPLLSEWVQQLWTQPARVELEKAHRPFRERIPEITQEAWRIVRGVALYVVIGIAIGAAMHGYVPEAFFARYLNGDQWWAVPLAVVLAVPMYANAAGMVPVIQVFVAKGVPLGTSLAFMMAVVGLSLPEATLLKKVMTLKLIGIFFGLVTLSIISLGFFFNLLFS